MLCDLVIDRECWTTGVVLDELNRGVSVYPRLADVATQDWLKVAPLDALDEIVLFAAWARRVGSGDRDLGEASVFAVAEARTAIAISDDRNAVRVARMYGVNVHGTIWMFAGACQAGKLREHVAGNLIDVLALHRAQAALHQG